MQRARGIVCAFLALVTVHFLCPVFPVLADERIGPELPEEFRPFVYAPPGATDWFEDARFGVFVHWGPYTLAGVPASWGRLGPRPGAKKVADSGVPAAVYDELYRKFDPVHFDADSWIRMVKASGAKYFIFTTKHHDGFCMFDARNTEYKITRTPFGRDVARELADSCHRHGIKLFWYYSQPDWQHPDCLTERNDQYRAYMYEHLEQLLTEYGPVAGLFFDGLNTTSSDWDTPRMLKLIRTWQPDILINRRWGWNMPGVNDNGDYDNAEQELGRFQIDRPWESCTTITPAWSWTGGDNTKTWETCLRMLIQCAGSGGNFALNSGPRPDGSINPPEIDVYERIGTWLSRYGESVYGTRGGPYPPGPWGVSCRKGNKVYLHLLAAFAHGVATEVELAALPAEVTGYRALNGATVQVKQKNGRLLISMERVALDPLDQVIELTLDRPAEALPVVRDMSPPLVPARIEASSSQSDRHAPEVLLGKTSGDFAEGLIHSGWWTPSPNDEEPQLIVHFARDIVVHHLGLSEQMRNCSTRRFAVACKESTGWRMLYEGTQIGMDFSLAFPAIQTSAIRVRFLENDAQLKPAISRIEIHGSFPGKP